MENFKVYIPRTRQARREKQIAQLEAMIRVRERNAQTVERYLRLFGHCKPLEWVQLRQQHLKRTIDSVWEMRAELDGLKTPPPVQLLMFNTNA